MNEAAAPLPQVLLSAPFIILLLLIAAGPIFFQKFWHHHYKKIAGGIGLLMIIVYLIKNDFIPVERAALEYFSFICLLAALYVASGGIYINADYKATPFTNVLLLLFGALISNVIGTTGAAILLIRPFLRLNQYRMKPYLPVFFIFIVCNVGGALTPIGDPPLFIGFLRGVPFEWTFNHLLSEWSFTVTILLLIFLAFDFMNKKGKENSKSFTGDVTIEGFSNFLWLSLIVASVFLDPAKVSWLPSIDGHSFVRELLQLTLAFCCYKTSSKKVLEHNKFHFEPILEVAFLFFGIFMSMIPALDLLENSIHSLKQTSTLSPSMFYWGTGASSSFLDNAPSYLTFLAAAMSYFGSSVNNVAEVAAFSSEPATTIYLAAISTAAVFFGAMTYIGNGPNFMVKAIAEDLEIETPGFFGYIIKFALPILLPVLFLDWLIFIR